MTEPGPDWREVCNAIAAQRNRALDTLAQVMVENARLAQELAAATAPKPEAKPDDDQRKTHECLRGGGVA